MELVALEPLYDDEFENELSDNLQWLQEQRKKDIAIRMKLLGFSLLLTIIAPFLQHYYPEAWTYILATGVAFTIGTNLLISVVSTRVEDKADKMEARMVELMDSLNEATDRLRDFHTQLDSVNIPGVQNMLDDVRNELAPGLNSLDDLDIKHIAHEIRRASRFVDTLDMDKVSKYLGHIQKEEFEMEYEFDEEDEEDFWAEPEPLPPLPSILSIKASQENEKQRQDRILSRLIG